MKELILNNCAVEMFLINKHKKTLQKVLQI